MKLKLIVYLIPTLFALTACNTTPSKKVVDPHTVFLKQQKTQYEELKNNDLNLWWQRLEDPQFLKILKKVQDSTYNSEQSFSQYETLTEKYGFFLEIPQWLLDSIQKNDTVILKNIYWHDGRTLTSAIVAQLYFEYQYCKQDQLILKAQLKNLEKNNINSENNSDNIELILEKKEKLEKHLLKTLSYVTDTPISKLNSMLTVTPLNHPFYTKNEIYFTPPIEAKNLLNRKDVLNSINDFYLVWNKYATPHEINISGFIQPSNINDIDNNYTFKIGDVKIEFSEEFNKIILEHSDVEDSKKSLLSILKNAIDETYPIYTQLNDLEKDFTNNQNYTLGLANKILKLREEGDESQQVVLEKQYLDSVFLNIQLQKQRFTLWLQLYLILGSGFNK